MSVLKTASSQNERLTQALGHRAFQAGRYRSILVAPSVVCHSPETGQAKRTSGRAELLFAPRRVGKLIGLCRLLPCRPGSPILDESDLKFTTLKVRFTRKWIQWI